MAQAIRMPPLGQTSDEIEILAWRKAEGDDVVHGRARMRERACVAKAESEGCD